MGLRAINKLTGDTYEVRRRIELDPILHTSDLWAIEPTPVPPWRLIESMGAHLMSPATVRRIRDQYADDIATARRRERQRTADHLAALRKAGLLLPGNGRR